MNKGQITDKPLYTDNHPITENVKIINIIRFNLYQINIVRKNFIK